jgi:hypothetical protein
MHDNACYLTEVRRMADGGDEGRFESDNCETLESDDCLAPYRNRPPLAPGAIASGRENQHLKIVYGQCDGPVGGRQTQVTPVFVTRAGVRSHARPVLRNYSVCAARDAECIAKLFEMAHRPFSSSSAPCGGRSLWKSRARQALRWACLRYAQRAGRDTGRLFIRLGGTFAQCIGRPHYSLIQRKSRQVSRTRCRPGSGFGGTCTGPLVPRQVRRVRNLQPVIWQELRNPGLLHELPRSQR